MKKLLIIAALFALTSCVKEDAPKPKNKCQTPNSGTKGCPVGTAD